VRGDQVAGRQIRASEPFDGRSYGFDFGVAGHIARRTPQFEAFADYFSFEHHNGPHGGVAKRFCFRRQFAATRQKNEDFCFGRHFFSTNILKNTWRRLVWAGKALPNSELATSAIQKAASTVIFFSENSLKTNGATPVLPPKRALWPHKKAEFPSFPGLVFSHNLLTIKRLSKKSAKNAA
jgi:hypothetical protein